MQNSRWAAKAASAPPKEPEQTVKTEETPPPPVEQVSNSRAHTIVYNNMTNDTNISNQTYEIPSPLPPADDMYSDPNMDQFAHTRPVDDLFDDDFVPVETEPQIDTIPDEYEHYPTSTDHYPSEPAPQSQDHQFAPQTESTSNNAPPDAPRGPRRPNLPAQQQRKKSAPNTKDAVEHTEEGAEGPLDPNAPPKAAPVRGDRSGTGGIRKAKLTEDELSEKLAAMKIKNAALVAAHEASIADAESFEAREAIAAQRRREEGVKRKELLGEREKNRIRKLKAQQGREWDVGKEEREEERGSRRGAFGGVVGSRVNRDEPRMMDDGDDAGRGGRGGFRGGRGGRGRGGQRGGSNQTQQRDTKDSTASQSIPRPSDFPDLPASSGVKEESKAPTKLEFPNKKPESKWSVGLEPITLEPSKDKLSWADQVESP